MGLGRAGDRALGIPAVRLAVLATVALLGGCSSASDLIGAVTGTAAAAGSGNPAVGIAIGVGARSAADWGLRHVSRRWHRTEQEAIAAAAADVPPGEARPWQVRHSLPFGAKQGEVRVLRAIDTPLAACREIAFSVEEDKPPARAWYLTSLCRDATGWRWATAEPATGRWGSLQ